MTVRGLLEVFNIGIVRYKVGYQDSIQKILEIQYGGGGGLFLEDFSIAFRTLQL